MKKCLITGATGLIGSEVLKNLHNDYEIFALVRKNGVRLSNIANCHWIEIDFNDRFDIDNLPEKMDYVIHLAQSEHHRLFPEYSLELFNVNTASTVQLLEYSRKAEVKNFVLVSSGGVYGNSSESFAEEEKLEIQPIGFYLGTKLCSEILSKAYTDYFNVITLRPFFVYGRNQRQEMLIPRLINNIKTGKAISLEGVNGIYLNPTYVSDAAYAISKAIYLSDSKTINIGGPEVLSLRAICNYIGDELKIAPSFVIKNVSEKKCIGKTDEMQKWLWEPKITFKEGIKLMLKEV